MSLNSWLAPDTRRTGVASPSCPSTQESGLTAGPRNRFPGALHSLADSDDNQVTALVGSTISTGTPSQAQSCYRQDNAGMADRWLATSASRVTVATPAFDKLAEARGPAPHAPSSTCDNTGPVRVGGRAKRAHLTAPSGPNEP
jgi:hypothetical protein